MTSKLTISSAVKLNSGFELPRLGYGVYKIPADQVTETTKEALSLGYRHVDTASAYKNQGPTGAALPASGLARSEVFFTTKVPTNAKPLGYDNVLELVDTALDETKLGYLDLVLIHWPQGGGPSARRDGWHALVECVDAGKIRSLGVSNYGVHHLEELETYIKELESERGQGKGGVISVGQWEIHPWLPRDDIVKWCQQRKIAIEAYCPIVRGERFGDPKIKALADKYGKSEAQVLLRWSLQKGYVPLVKSVTSSRIQENADVFDFELTEDEVKDITTEEYSVCSWDPTVEPLEK